jgi:hypothetical protein
MQGHWQIELLGFHVGNITLDHCRKGGCRGVVDSGTSHIAIPSPHESEVVDFLTLDADGISDCRHLDNYPTIIIELRDFNLTLYPEDYMRQLPVPVNIQLGAGSNNSTSTEKEEEEEEPELEIPRVCRPRVVGVSMPPEIGDKTFILGQSVLHRYYTVFDFDGPRVGFGLAAGRVESPGELEDFMRRREWPQSDPWPAAPPQWPELNPQDRQQHPQDQRQHPQDQQQHPLQDQQQHPLQDQQQHPQGQQQHQQDQWSPFLLCLMAIPMVRFRRTCRTCARGASSSDRLSTSTGVLLGSGRMDHQGVR